jgi:hypothetical protein
MGVLTDLVVVDLSKAEEVARSFVPAREFRGLDAKGIDPVKLCQLSAVLVDKPYDRACPRQFVLLAGNEADGPWVTSVPSELVATLAALPEGQIPDVAAKWHDTEEFKLDGWTLEDVKATLRGIWSLAKRAEAEQKPILMWMSL